MLQKLQLLYNTLLTIETKGLNTITMADCLRYIEKLIQQENNNEIQNNSTEEKLQS